MISLLFQLSFTFWRDRTQCNTSAFFVNPTDPSCDDITHLNGFVQVFDVRLRNLADVNQTAAVRCEFNEDAKRHHADNHSDHLITRLQRRQRRHRRQNRWRRTTEIDFTKWIAQTIDDLIRSLLADLPLFDPFINQRLLWLRTSNHSNLSWLRFFSGWLWRRCFRLWNTVSVMLSDSLFRNWFRNWLFSDGLYRSFSRNQFLLNRRIDSFGHAVRVFQQFLGE